MSRTTHDDDDDAVTGYRMLVAPVSAMCAAAVADVCVDVALAADVTTLPAYATDWPAAQQWRPPWSRLLQLCGQATVTAMRSDSPVFRGDMRHHRPVSLRLSDLLTERSTSSAVQQHLFLAQEPLWQLGKPCALAPLLADLPPAPRLVPRDRLYSVALWLSPQQTHSSLHFDPYDNLLVVLSGEKRVTVCAPSAVRLLAPQTIGGEASNHSRLTGELPEGVQSTVVTLRSGDALYLPAGFWHSVYSPEGTCAVSFWWRSRLSELLDGRSDAFIARSAVEALMEEEKRLIIESAEAAAHAGGGWVSADASVAALEAAAAMADAASRCAALETVLASCSGREIRSVLLRLQPDALRRLLLSSLSPLGAELYTRRMEEAGAEGDDDAFFTKLYGMLGGEDDRQAFLDALLDSKDCFARAARERVLSTVLA